MTEIDHGIDFNILENLFFGVGTSFPDTKDLFDNQTTDWKVF